MTHLTGKRDSYDEYNDDLLAAVGTAEGLIDTLPVRI